MTSFFSHKRRSNELFVFLLACPIIGQWPNLGGGGGHVDIAPGPVEEGGPDVVLGGFFLCCLLELLTQTVR